MATRPFTRVTRRKPKHKPNPQLRRDRRPLPTRESMEAALALIPNLPRSLLCRLTERLIEHLDEMDGDVDLEPEEDRCDAGDDGIFSGAVVRHYYEQRNGTRDEAGDDVDAERQQMADDVPCLRVYRIEPNENGRRAIAGYSGNGRVPSGRKRF